MNRYPVEVFYSDEDKGFIARYPDLPGCSAFGETEEEALREARDAAKSWLQAAKATRRSLPTPSRPARQDFSGRFVLRVPKELHADLARQAKTQGVSLNQYLLYIIAERNPAKAA